MSFCDIGYSVITSLVLLLIPNTAILGFPHGKLMKMFGQEQFMLNQLERYIEQQEIHVQVLERQLKEVCSSVSHDVDREHYVRHPINNYVLVRRLVVDWPNIVRIAPNFSTPYPNVRWPGLEELRAVMRYLFRLQETYQLQTAHLAQGFVDGDQADVVVTGLDTFLMAEAKTQSRDFHLSKEWLDQTLAKGDNTASSTDILEAKVLSDCFLGDSTGSIYALTQLLEDFPHFKPSPYLLNTWQMIADFDCPTHKQALENMRPRLQHSKTDQDDMNRFNSLCRVASGSSLQPQHVLSCRYVHYNKTRLMLGHFRAEELQLDPPVLLFHDIISDAEIREVQRCASRRTMKVSRVYTVRPWIGGVDVDVAVDAHRSSESSCLRSTDCNVVDRLEQRMGDMTNLDYATAEKSQVNRYGVGGEYLFHRDIPANHTCSANCRIATLMTYVSNMKRTEFPCIERSSERPSAYKGGPTYLYVSLQLNDVPSGGHTVFRHWGLSVRPQKGAALFWFNYHRNGTGDDSTEHAGCPVIRGTKWVLNLWYHHFSTTSLCHKDDDRASLKHFYV